MSNDQTPDGVREFYRLNCLTRREHGLPPQPFRFFRTSPGACPGKRVRDPLLARHKEKAIAGAVFLHFAGKAIYKYGASDRRYQELRPNNLVFREGIRIPVRERCADAIVRAHGPRPRRAAAVQALLGGDGNEASIRQVRREFEVVLSGRNPSRQSTPGKARCRSFPSRFSDSSDTSPTGTSGRLARIRKNEEMFLKTYYQIKPLIPRRLQIAMRRLRARIKLRTHADVWPIDEKAATPPKDWKGWPDGKRFAFVMTHDVETARGRTVAAPSIDLERELGFIASYNFVPERYKVREELRNYLTENGFEVGVHGLNHDGKYYNSRAIFRERAMKINRYMKDWESVGFRSPSMLHNLDWLHDLDIEYDSSTFDTDPFEPQPDGIGTIFPFWVPSGNGKEGYVEIPYTLPQDFTLFILMKQKNIDIWKRKLDWIASKGGMALMLDPSRLHQS